MVRSTKDLTAAAGGGDNAPRRARGFQSASGVFRSMMLLVGVIVVGEVCNVWSKTLKNGQKTITNFLIVLISFASRVGLKK